MRTLRPVRASHTVHRIERDAEHKRTISGPRERGDRLGVSSSACTTFPVATSTMFTASTHAVATRCHRRQTHGTARVEHLEAGRRGILRGCA